MKFILLSFFLALSTASFASSCPPDLDKKKPIDQVITKLADVDGDGLEDKLELHLKGKDFHSPITWGLKIYSKGKVIYQRSGSNKRIEPFFSQKGYIAGCTGYDDCKCKWFFHDYLDQMIIKMTSENAGVFDKTAPNSIYATAKKYLHKEYKKNPKFVDKAINNAVERLLSGKAVAIQAFDEPEITTPPMIWMPEFKRFVPIYED
ncbi:MAG TPA: hypothetical protein VI298_10035 [Geobacteraceae bacterium]